MEIIKDWSYFVSDLSVRGAQRSMRATKCWSQRTGRVRLFAHRAAKTRCNSVVRGAAHLDEDWNMQQWGRDELALQRRAYRYAELQAAAKVLQLYNRLGTAKA